MLDDTVSSVEIGIRPVGYIGPSDMAGVVQGFTLLWFLAAMLFGYVYLGMAAWYNVDPIRGISGTVLYVVAQWFNLQKR